MPEISVVIESLNAESDAAVELADTLESLKKQTFPYSSMEIVIVVEDSNRGLQEYLAANYPALRLVKVSKPTYYSMKFHGIQAAKGEIIALLDSDCIPVPDWAEEIVRTIKAGADLVAGKSRYPENEPLMRLFNLFSFGHICCGPDGMANSFIPNNVAFKRDFVLALPLDDRRRRSFGAYQIATEAKRAGRKLVYNPLQRVQHFNYGIRYHLANRFRAGYEAVSWCRLDDKHVLPETRYLKFGIVTPLIFYARRLQHDLRMLMNNRDDLGINMLEIPFFILAAAILRTTEVASGLVAVIRPDYLGRRYEW